MKTPGMFKMSGVSANHRYETKGLLWLISNVARNILARNLYLISHCPKGDVLGHLALAAVVPFYWSNRCSQVTVGPPFTVTALNTADVLVSVVR